MVKNKKMESNDFLILDSQHSVSSDSLILYNKLKGLLKDSKPTVFNQVLFLTCDILSNIVLKNASKEKIKSRITALTSKGFKLSNSVLNYVEDNLFDQISNLKLAERLNKQMIAMHIFQSSLQNEKLLKADFKQFRNNISSKLPLSDQQSFITICDFLYSFVRTDNTTSLFESPDSRIKNIEKHLNRKTEIAEQDIIKKILFYFKPIRISSVYQESLQPPHRTQRDFEILKRMCQKTFLEMTIRNMRSDHHQRTIHMKQQTGGRSNG